MIEMVGSDNQPDCTRRCKDFSKSGWGFALYVSIVMLMLMVIGLVNLFVLALNDFAEGLMSAHPQPEVNRQLIRK